MQALLAAHAVRVVRDAAELGRAVTELLRDADARQRMGSQALQVIAAGRGSCVRVMALLPASG
jgi:3-deoxy-D-manno-octulosonic-acid transferase